MRRLVAMGALTIVLVLMAGLAARRERPALLARASGLVFASDALPLFELASDAEPLFASRQRRARAPDREPAPAPLELALAVAEPASSAAEDEPPLALYDPPAATVVYFVAKIPEPRREPIVMRAYTSDVRGGVPFTPPRVPQIVGAPQRPRALPRSTPARRPVVAAGSARSSARAASRPVAMRRAR